MTQTLHSLFDAVASKKLVLVDLPKRGSNQHEINASSSLREFFQTGNPLRGVIDWHRFSDASDPVRDTGKFTFYDSRAKGHERTGRSPEWRMYYYGDFLRCASPGDTLILLKTRSHEYHGLVFERGSGWLRAAEHLFATGSAGDKFKIQDKRKLDLSALEFTRSRILEELEIDIEIPADKDVVTLAEKALRQASMEGREFPSTQFMSNLAREGYELKDEDEYLVNCLEQEERIFRAAEAVVVGKRLKTAFSDVDEFVKYSLTVHNRRKSRMGYSLQNHLDFVFRSKKLKFETQKVTERKSRPDFLFPGQAEYQDQKFKPTKLVMLGAKSSCKERWRQILAEADRIKNKHLCTLESAISRDQTDDMKSQNVILVIPEKIRLTYLPAQVESILNINAFIAQVRKSQR